MKIFLLLHDYESDQIIKCLLEILGAKYSNTDKIKLFFTFHNYFQDHVVEIAWDLEKELNLKYLLSDCIDSYVGVEYCEGRPWPTDQ